MSSLRENLEKLPPPVRQWGLFAAWIAGLFLISILLWAFTQNLRSQIMLNAVNKALARSEIPYRLEAPLSPLGRPGRAMQLGSWFSLSGSDSWAVVFPLISGGTLSAMLAIASPEGIVELMAPLTLSAEQSFRELPEGTVRIYSRRIEESVDLLQRGKR